MERLLRIRAIVRMNAAGFSLIEVLVAMAIVTSGVASLSQVFFMSAEAIRVAGGISIALLLAEDKMEQLRASPHPSALSPPGTLSADSAGYVDFFDAGGELLAEGATIAPDGVAYVRRWSVSLLSAGSVTAVVLQVVVIPWAASRHANARGTVHLVGMAGGHGP
jgi:prepilin-type N-terminal cleavage/methylation domain-containing protein